MRVLREPLVQVLALGALLFVLHGWVSDRPAAERGAIVVTAGQVESLVTTFARTFQRPPSAQELDGLVEDYVRDEVLAREAIALGLDRDDVVIRRRLRQKMEFVTDDLAATTVPSDAELGAYLAAHVESFRLEPRLSFSQVYFDPSHHRTLEDDVRAALGALRRGGRAADSSALGDASLLERQHVDVSRSDVARVFGEDFATEVAALEPGTWQGPVRSGYGLHLVLVQAWTAGQVPALDEVRTAVEREWSSARRRELEEQLYARLRQRYTITVERAAPGAGALAAGMP